MDKRYFQDRFERLQNLLEQSNVDCLLIEDPIDLYYMTGLELSRGILFVYAAGSTLFVDSRYFEVCRESCPVDIESDLNIDQWLQNKVSIHKVGFDATALTYQRYLDWQKKFAEIKRESPLTLVNCPSAVKELRLIKDGAEIALLRKAAALGSIGYDYVLSLLEEGVSESYIARKLEIFWKTQGARGLAFDPIIAFGANSSKPHYRAGDATLKAGDTVLIDIGVNWNHYHSDMTRTVCFGQSCAQMQKVHSIVLEAQLAALGLCRPGCLIADLDAAARNIIANHGFGSHFTHSLGHGVGLEIHEAPAIRKTENSTCLEEGMVITIEPGIYLPGIGGVRIEDSVLIIPDGYENLTRRSKGFLSY